MPTYPFKANDYITVEQVREHFPGALEKLRKNYEFALQDDPEGFKDQFEVDTTEALVNEVIDFYVSEDYRDPSVLRLAFTEPNLGTNVEARWHPEYEDLDGTPGAWES